PAVVALGADAAGGPGADRRRLVGRRAGAARLLHRRRRDPRAVLDLSGTPGAGRRAPRLVRARPLRLASVHTTIVRAPLTSHRRRMRRLAALRTHLAVDTARRHRAGAQPLERNLDAAIDAHAVGAFVDPTQRRAQPAPFVDVAQCLRHLDFAFVQDRRQVAAVTDAVERGKLLRSLAELAGNLFFEHDQALTNLREQLVELGFGQRHSQASGHDAAHPTCGPGLDLDRGQALRVGRSASGKAPARAAPDHGAIRSTTSVISVSRPQPNSSSAGAGSLTVYAMTRRPASWAAAITDCDSVDCSASSATQPSARQRCSQSSGNSPNSSARGNPGATRRAASSAAAENDDRTGGTAAPCQSCRASSAAAAPVSASRPGQGLISMLALYALRSSQRATRASVGIDSPAKAAECQPPASRRARSPNEHPATRPVPSVVRSRVASCISTSTPSPLSFTSNSNIV